MRQRIPESSRFRCLRRRSKSLTESERVLFRRARIFRRRLRAWTRVSKRTSSLSFPRSNPSSFSRSSVLTKAALGFPRDSKRTRTLPYATLFMRLERAFLACAMLAFWRSIIMAIIAIMSKVSRNRFVRGSRGGLYSRFFPRPGSLQIQIQSNNYSTTTETEYC